MRRALIALCLLAVACYGVEPHRLLMARHRSVGEGTAHYYDADPDGIMQYCEMWLACNADVDPIPDESGNSVTGARSATGTTFDSDESTGWLDYNGTSGALNAGKPTIDNADPWSLTAWYWANDTGRGAIYASDFSGYNDDVMLGINPGTGGTAEKIGCVHHNNNGSIIEAVADPTTVTTGAWQFVACTYNKTNLVLYVNGIQVDIEPINADAGLGIVVDHEVGHNPAASIWWDGKLDDVTRWSIALSSNQQHTIYTAGPLYTP